jgi:hypothetical protein
MNTKEIITILLISLGITTLGLLIDTDPKNNSLWTTVFEYVAMLTFIFTAITLLYIVSVFAFKKIKQKMV